MKTKIGNVATMGLALIMAMVLLTSSSMAKGTNKQSWERVELQDLYMDYLAEEGYKPKIDSDGDVQFKREGKVYFVDVDEEDPEFFRVVLPNIWSIDNARERSEVFAAANAANAKSKVSKVFTVGDNVWVSVELYVAYPEDFKGVFRRVMSGISNGSAQFVKKMRE